MLTGELIRVRVRKQSIHPSFIKLEPRRMERAAELLSLIEEATEERWTRGQLTEATRELEGTDVDHKITRGMVKLLLDGCEFETVSPLPPDELRWQAFRRAAETGPLARESGLTERRTAQTVLGELADALEGECSAASLSESLYADLKEHQRIQFRKGPSTPEALVHRYNIALVQAVLLKARQISLRLKSPEPKRIRQLFRYLKFFQLMYRVQRLENGDLAIEVDGPQSLLKQSTRYGMQLATFFPAVVLQPGSWDLQAEILWGRKRKLRKHLELSSELELVSHYRDTGTWRSQIELWFEERFAKLDTDWKLSPGQPIDLGEQQMMVPDFTFRRGDRVGHLDIVGYWRKGYLKGRLERTPEHVILAVSKGLSGETKALPKTVQSQILSFAKVIPAKDVVQRLEAIARTERV
jgi:predicted nuclease of restriction endonuclease-like RecB superfamily